MLAFKLPVIRVLLNHGADVNLVTQNGFDALALAVRADFNNKDDTLEVTKLILDSGALVNKRCWNGWTALMQASMQGSAVTVRLLLNHKDIDVHLRDDSGKTALDLARDFCHEEIVELLENHIRKETLLSTPLLLQRELSPTKSASKSHDHWPPPLAPSDGLKDSTFELYVGHMLFE